MFGWFGKVSFVPYTKVSDFAVHLKDGRLMGSKCKGCGFLTFPPRADCPECGGGEFEFSRYTGRGTIYTYSTIEAAPTGFDDAAPYTVVLVALEEGGRLVGWLGDSIPVENIEIGMEVQVVPRVFDDSEEIRLYLSVETPGAKWQEAPAAHLG